jgi:predicted nucleic acid-binding protein
MPARILLDTNVLVYVYDLAEPGKQQRALEVVDGLITAELGAVSTQVLGEFFVVLTRRLASPLTATAAYIRLQHYSQVLRVFEMTAATVLEAARGVRDYRFSYFDAQIWATARLNQIPTVFSEDFNTGANIEGVTFINPFSAGFQLADWLA